MLDKDNKMLDIIKWRLRSTKKHSKILFVLGILICLAGAALMFDGAILGVTTTNIATINYSEKGISYLTDTMGRITVTGGQSSPVGAAAALLKDLIHSSVFAPAHR